MKTILKLLVVAAIVNATVRVAMASWQFYQLKDAAEQILLFGDNLSVAQLQDQIARRAVNLEIPIDPAAIEVTRDTFRTLARGSYTQPVEVFPRYTYPMEYSFEVDTLAVNPRNAEELEKRAR